MAQSDEKKTLDVEEVSLSKILRARDTKKLQLMVKEFEKCGEFTPEFYVCLYQLCDDKKSDDDLLKIMLGCRRFNVNKKHSNGETISHALVRRNHYRWVQYLLKNFAKLDINATCKNMKTPILLAAEHCHIALLELLESNSGNIHGCDVMKFSVLHWMASHGILEWIRYLIEKKSFAIEQKNIYGDTPVTRATSRGHHECCQYLLKMGARVSVVDRDGRTLLHTSVYGGNVNCLNAILAHSESKYLINLRDRHGKTALNWAAGKGNEKMVISLLKANAKVDIRDKNQQTALMWASRGGHQDIVELLISAKANLDYRDKKNNTAITWAAAHRHTGTVNILLRAGANVNWRDGYGMSALDYAWQGNKTLLNNLLQHQNINVNGRNEKGDTFLMRAIKRSNVDIVRSLIKANANLDLQNNLGETALILATAYRELPCVVELLKHNANPNLSDLTGETALTKAYQWRVNPDLIQMLKNAGAVI